MPKRPSFKGKFSLLSLLNPCGYGVPENRPTPSLEHRKRRAMGQQAVTMVLPSYSPWNIGLGDPAAVPSHQVQAGPPGSTWFLGPPYQGFRSFSEFFFLRDAYCPVCWYLLEGAPLGSTHTHLSFHLGGGKMVLIILIFLSPLLSFYLLFVYFL